MKLMGKTTLFLAIVFASSAVYAASPKADYAKARSCYREVKSGPSDAKSRSHWIKCINLFEDVHRRYPKSPQGLRALFSVARLRQELYDRFKGQKDITAAIKVYNRVIREYPDDSLADDALYRIGCLRYDVLKQDDRARRAFNFLLENYPHGDMALQARRKLDSMKEGKPAPKPTSGAGDAAQAEPTKEEQAETDVSPFEGSVAGPFDRVTLESIDIQEKAFATGVVLNLSRSAAYSLKFSELGRRTKSPPRLELFLSYVRPSDVLGKDFIISSAYLDKIKLRSRILGSGIKLIFTMAPGASYEVNQRGRNIELTFRREGEKGKEQASGSKKRAASARAAPLRVVIDPGHGGEDTGAIGPGGNKEKDVTLAISKRLARELSRQPGIKVFLTRKRDRGLTLEERNAYAVKKKADLFVSIHVNASTKKSMRGIETYYLNNATDEAAARLAKSENRAAGKKLSVVEHIMSTMLQNYDAAESAQLAQDIQRGLVRRMDSRYPRVRDRGVRSALFYVLVGAKCPSVLIETSFISNPLEERRLGLKHYREHLAIGIAEGVASYVQLRDKRMVSL